MKPTICACGPSFGSKRADEIAQEIEIELAAGLAHTLSRSEVM